jgi:hypothetical protein
MRLLEEKLAIANKGKVRVSTAMTVPQISAHLSGGWSAGLADGPLDSIKFLQKATKRRFKIQR